MENHTTMIGPNTLPMAPVPRLWMANRATRMPIEMGTTKSEIPETASSVPSTADSTEIAGVIMPSP